MKTRPLAVALLVALAPATFPVTAFAQSEAEDPVTAMARARFKEGVEFYDKGQFDKARASFLQAYALKKHPAVLLNLAWSCLKSGHALDAEHYFKQFLTEGKEITDKQRNDANDGLSQSRGKIGRIEITAPAGTEITIDGDRAGSAPLGEPIAVEPGAHTVTFKAADGGTDTQSVSVLGGEKATARFGRKSGGAAGGGVGAGGGEAAHGAEPAPTPSPTPPPPEGTTPPEETQQPPAEAKPAKHASKTVTKEVSGPSIFTPPDNMLPVVIGGVLTAASAAVAIAMAVAKSQAADSQTNTANQVRSAGLQCDPAGNPSNLNMPPSPALASACSSYDNDVANQNTDATVGNIAIGVGIAALVGTAVYWFVGDKSDPAAANGARGPSVTPYVGATPGGGSFSLAGRF
jgi:hypothetical protein